MMKLRNCIEKKLNKQISWWPSFVGYRGGRRCYQIDFEDGTSDDYFIDFENQELEVIN